MKRVVDGRMKKTELCSDCGIPLMIGKELSWEDNGVITLRRSPLNRMVFYESRVIDNLFQGIERLIGLPIEHIVIESRRRDVRKYIERSFPGWVIGSLRWAGKYADDPGLLGRAIRRPAMQVGKALTLRVMEMGRLYGYGRAELGEGWERDDPFPWRESLVRHPYSVPFWSADALGSAEAIEGVEQWVKYESLGEETYRVTTYPSEHPVELKERLRRRKKYPFKPGNIAFQRCPSCGLPLELSRYRWYPEEGIIIDTENDWRMSIFGPQALEAVLDDLESELGEDIPRVVVEAQKGYIKSRTGQMNWRRSGTTFNKLTALRGMGNITGFEADEKHLSVRIQNACLPLIMVGMAQALYEIALGLEDSTYEWELSDDGDLDIIVKAG